MTEFSADKTKLYLDFEDIPRVRERIANGYYNVGDSLMFKNNQVKVIGVNAESKLLPPHITVMSGVLYDARPFDEKGNNHWAISSLRRYLNEEYPNRYPVLNELAHEVFKKNNDGQADTLDRFWLLSLSELDDELSPYKEFVSDIRNLRNDCSRWLRSANRGNALNTWYVHSSGHVSYNYASYAFSFSPVCVLW